MSQKRSISPDDANSADRIGKGRIRVLKACIRCKQRKIKCDGLSPCGPCGKSDAECIYGPSSRDKKVSYVIVRSNTASGNSGVSATIAGSTSPSTSTTSTTNNNNAPSSSKNLNITSATRITLSNLLERIEQLEELQQQQIISNSDDDNDNANDVVEEISKYCEVGKSLAVVGNRWLTRRISGFLANVFGKSLYDGLPPSSQKLVEIPRIQGYGFNMSGVHYLKRNELGSSLSSSPYANADVDIEKSLGSSLVTYFMNHVNPLYAILHKTMFLKQFESYLESSEGQKNNSLLLFTALYRLVCAISMRFSEVAKREVYPERLEEKLFDSGYSIIQFLSFQWQSVEIIQGWLLITLYLRTCHRQTSSWMALGQAIRLTQVMGITYTKKAFKLNNNHNDYDMKKRCRVFWCCYTWDRLLSMDAGIPSTLRDESISLPPVLEYVDDGWLTEPAYALIKLSRCLSPLRHDVGIGMSESVTKSLHQSLMDWNTDMAKLGLASDEWYHTSRPDIDPNILCQLRVQFHESILYIHMRSIFTMIVPELTKKFTNCTDRYRLAALDSSKAIITCLNQLSKLGKLENCWWLKLSSIHNAVIVLLIFIKCGYDSKKLVSLVNTGMNLVDQLADDGRFKMSKECQWSLRTLNYLLYLRMKGYQMSLKSHRSDQDSEVNKHTFIGLGTLDNEGNTELFPDTKELVNDDGTDSNNLSTPAKSPTKDFGFNGDIRLEESIQDVESSIGWFNGWAWDNDASQAFYMKEI